MFCSILEDHQSNMDPTPKKFIRRPDLTLQVRLYIAFTTLMAMGGGAWGKISALSKEFMISRTFAYMLALELEQAAPIIFRQPCAKPVMIRQKDPVYHILSLRLEGRCSIEAISTIMKRFGVKNSSVGFISQCLHQVGSLLSSTLTVDHGKIQLLVYLSDEIFSKHKPILVTVDPASSAILKIQLSDTRKAKDWEEHWQCLEKNGYFALYLVCDEGSGLRKAHKEALKDIFRQPDTYHSIAHQLGKWVKKLENEAYAAINKEDECWRKLDSARTDAVIEKRISEYEKAVKITEEKIQRYEFYSFLYLSIIEEMKVFDRNGELRDRQEAQANIETALDLMESLGRSKIKISVDSIKRTLPDLLNYFDVAHSIVEELKALPIEEQPLTVLCAAWQWRKNRIKAKTSKGRKWCETNEHHCLEIAAGHLDQGYENVKERIYWELDQIVQSSSLVECINSIIRPYLNTSKNHVTQEMLNLIMFYHNHRRYKAGKRKGKTPMEILTGRKQEKDWLDLLFDIVEQKQSLPAVA